jgi:hypothetical protein
MQSRGNIGAEAATGFKKKLGWRVFRIHVQRRCKTKLAWKGMNHHSIPQAAAATDSFSKPLAG